MGEAAEDELNAAYANGDSLEVAPSRDVLWHRAWEEARNEMALAEEQYRIADSALAVATARRREAERRCASLFRERMVRVNGTDR